MKKLLLFSVLFLTCSLGLMNVKAQYCNDGSYIEIFDIFDDETYDISHSNRDKIVYNIPIQVYKEKYTQSYYDLVAYIYVNYKYYYFGVDNVFMWNRDDIELTMLFYNNITSNSYNYLAFRLSSFTEGKTDVSEDIKQFSYYDLRNGFSEDKNKAYDYENLYPMASYDYKGNRTYFKFSTSFCGLIMNVPEVWASSGLNTNAKFVYRGNSYTQDGRKLFSNQEVQFYDTIYVGDTVYHDADYITGKVENPKISLKYLTTTGDETGVKIGATVSVDFNTFENSTRYSYLLSFDNGKTWDDKRLSMSSSVYTFSKLENFEVIAQLYDSQTGKSYYSSLLVNNIDMNYHSRWLSFERDDSNDEYTIFNGINYLTSTTINVIEKFNEINDYPLTLYYSYDGKSWSRMSHSNAHFTVHSNSPTYFLYRDVGGNSVFTSTYIASCFQETSFLGEIINFDEEQPMDDTFIVYVTFVNFQENHSYWVKEQSEEYQEISMRVYNGMYKWTTQEKKTYCAKITEKGDGSKVLQEQCHTVQGLRIVEDMGSYVDSTIEFIDNQRSKLDEIGNLIQRMYDSLPILIKNFLVFSYFLFCMSAIIWNIRK